MERGEEMIPVLHFCAKDADLMAKNLDWWISLDGKVDFHAILSHDDATPARQVEAVKKLADQYFRSTEVFWYPQPLKKSWPAAPNWAWQNTARYIAATKNEPWFWIESDVVAIRKRWLVDIAEEHQRVGKPFSGHFVDGMGHLNGCAVYPPNVALYSVDAFRTEESAWDVVLGKSLSLDGDPLKHVHPSHKLFQHCWCINPADGKAWNGSGELATFKNTHDVVRLVDLTMAIFHRCKDGTLIDMLRLHYAHPELAMVPQHTEQGFPAVDGVRDLIEVRKEFKEWKTEDNVNDIAKNSLRKDGEAEKVEENKPGDSGCTYPNAISESSGEKMERKTDEIRQGISFSGICEMLIVTYGLPTKRVSGLVVSDFDWLKWCLRCIRKHCTGFAGITVAFPDRDAKLFSEISKEHAQAKSGIPLKAKMYTEQDGVGMIQHMGILATPDKLTPKTTTHVLHVDADYMFKEAVTPEDYFCGDKPIYVTRSWESLTDKKSGVVSDCLQWRIPTETQLGFVSEVYAMCRFPFGFPLSFYPMYREHIEKVHGQRFIDYMTSGRNSFPQNRMDFTAMGAFAYHKAPELFSWIDVSGGNHLAPKDKIKGFWSHGGITPEIQKEIESYLA